MKHRTNDLGYILRGLMVFFWGLGTVFLPHQVVQAATFTVTNNHSSGAGSLLQVILDASSGDTIVFADDFTIQLTNTLEIDKDLTFDGSGHDVVISGDWDGDGIGDVQAFNIHSDVSVSIIHLTFTKSPADFSIVRNYGTLTVADTSFINNSRQGIFNDGSLVVENSTFSNNTSPDGIQGSAIWNRGGMVLRNSTFSGNNSGGAGGAVATIGSATISNCTFSGNHSRSSIGGGAIYNNGTLTAANITLSGNSADQIGGGIYSSGTVTVRNSLIVNSTKGSCFGTIIGSNNLTDDNTCGVGFTNSSSILLGVLGDYGGETQTIPLLAGSAAMDAGDSLTCADPATVNGLDQRGVIRPQGAGCDIGAYETEKNAVAVSVEQAADQPDPTHTDSIQFTVTFAEAVTGFTASDVTLSGTASGPLKASLRGSGMDYTVTVSGMTGSGTVSVSVPANIATGEGGGQNLASTSTDNVVTYLENESTIPLTGFAPGQQTGLPEQTVEKAYSRENMWIEIPALGLSQDIVGVPEGLGGWNVSWLGDNIGYLEGTAFPTWAGNSVLTGHVTGADGLNGPFANLDNLTYGEQVILHAFGQKYVYEVRNVNLWVNPNSTGILTRHEDFPWLTLITCRGYDEDSGSYRWRTVVRAVQVAVQDE